MEKSNNHELPRVMNKRHTHTQNSPHEHNDWEIVSRLENLNGNVVWNLTTEIARIEDCVDLIKLDAIHLQIFFHPRCVGIAEILIRLVSVTLEEAASTY